jgi:hypothetical protein
LLVEWLGASPIFHKILTNNPKPAARLHVS